MLNTQQKRIFNLCKRKYCVSWTGVIVLLKQKELDRQQTIFSDDPPHSSLADICDTHSGLQVSANKSIPERHVQCGAIVFVFGCDEVKEARRATGGRYRDIHASSPLLHLIQHNERSATQLMLFQILDACLTPRGGVHNNEVQTSTRRADSHHHKFKFFTKKSVITKKV